MKLLEYTVKTGRINRIEIAITAPVKIVERAFQVTSIRLRIPHHAHGIQLRHQIKTACKAIAKAMPAMPDQPSAAEALAMEVPVVATGHGGMLDIVIEGKTGRLFQPGDHDVLAQSVADLGAHKPSDLRVFVEQNFTLATMVDKTLQVYLQL